MWLKKWHWDGFFSKCFGFHISIIQPWLHTCVSYGGWTTGPLVAAVHRKSLATDMDNMVSQIMKSLLTSTELFQMLWQSQRETGVLRDTNIILQKKKTSCARNTKSLYYLNVTWLSVKLSLVSWCWSARMKAYFSAFKCSLQNIARCRHEKYQLMRFKHMQALRTKSQ
jgi:hypothetical protein